MLYRDVPEFQLILTFQAAYDAKTLREKQHAVVVHANIRDSCVEDKQQNDSEWKSSCGLEVRTYEVGADSIISVLI